MVLNWYPTHKHRQRYRLKVHLMGGLLSPGLSTYYFLLVLFSESEGLWENGLLDISQNSHNENQSITCSASVQPLCLVTV